MNESTFEPIPAPEPAKPAPLPSPAEEEPIFMLSGRKRKTIWPFIVIPLACILLLAGIFAFWYTRPKTILNQTLGSYARTWIDDESVLASFASVAESGQIHMELSNEEIYPTPITLDLYAPTKRGRVAQISMDDEKYRLYAAPNAIMVAGTTLDGNVYGIKPESIYQQFEESIFYPKADGKYGIPFYQHELYDLEQSLWQFERAYQADEPTAPADFGDKYYDLFIDCLLEEAKIEITEKGSNREMEITLSPEALENAIYSFFSTLTGDEELIAYLDAYSPMDRTDDFDNWTEEFEWLMDQAESTAENYRTLKISLTIRMEYTPFTRRLQALSVTLENENGPMTRVELDTIRTGCAVLSMSTEGTKALELRLTQNDYEFRVELEALNNRGSLSTVLDLHYLAQEDGSYQLSLSAWEGNVLEEYILKGTKTEADGVLRITLDTLRVKASGAQYSDETVKVGLMVELHEKAKSPSIPKKYRNLLTISEEEMDTVAEQIGADPDELGSNLKEIYQYLSERITITG